MTWWIKEELIHFEHPETKHPSVLCLFVCRSYWIAFAVICRGCYYHGCGDLKMFEFSSGNPLSLSETTCVPALSLFRHRTVQKQNIHQLSIPYMPQLGQRTPQRAIGEQRILSRVHPSFQITVYSVLSFDPFQQPDLWIRGLRADLHSGSSFWVTQNNPSMPRQQK